MLCCSVLCCAVAVLWLCCVVAVPACCRCCPAAVYGYIYIYIYVCIYIYAFYFSHAKPLALALDTAHEENQQNAMRTSIRPIGARGSRRSPNRLYSSNARELVINPLIPSSHHEPTPLERKEIEHARRLRHRAARPRSKDTKGEQQYQSPAS